MKKRETPLSRLKGVSKMITKEVQYVIDAYSTTKSVYNLSPKEIKMIIGRVHKDIETLTSELLPDSYSFMTYWAGQGTGLSKEDAYTSFMNLPLIVQICKLIDTYKEACKQLEAFVA